MRERIQRYVLAENLRDAGAPALLAGKARGVHMTTLVDSLIRAALAAEQPRPVPVTPAVPEQTVELRKVAA